MASRSSQVSAGLEPPGGAAIGYGLIAGVVAGMVFALFEMIMASLMGQGFFAPLRMIGAILLGEAALESSYALATAVPVGLIVHLVLSAIYGAVFAALYEALRRPNRLVTVAGATVYGVILWVVNFYLIAPLLFPWFRMADQTVQFVAHAVFFGTVLGAVTAARAGREDRVPGAPAPPHAV